MDYLWKSIVVVVVVTEEGQTDGFVEGYVVE